VPPDRLRLLDLFCCAGGASMGYHRAGFDVVGVDLKPQPRYPFEFIQADALTFPLGDYDAIHASPPCQDYSKNMRHLADGYPRLIDPIRERFRTTGKPWVIENVDGAPLPHQSDLFGSHGVELCGSMFGLRIFRHRLFETSFPIIAPRGCDHTLLPQNPHNAKNRRLWREEFGPGVPIERTWREEMGVGWMDGDEGREAIPPAYTEHIGRALLGHLSERAA
jgi:DNA (cytosine-5)-methyltransferase 1